MVETSTFVVGGKLTSMYISLTRLVEEAQGEVAEHATDNNDAPDDDDVSPPVGLHAVVIQHLASGDGASVDGVVGRASGPEQMMIKVMTKGSMGNPYIQTTKGTTGAGSRTWQYKEVSS